MSDDTPRNVIEPGGPAERVGIPSNPENPGSSEGPDRVPSERGMPELGQHGGGRPRAWWLTPLVIVVFIVVGAVWTAHGLLARHDAAARARRDAALDQPAQGRIFSDEPASAARVPASAGQSASVPAAQPAFASAVAVTRSPVSPGRLAGVRSYYDARRFRSAGRWRSRRAAKWYRDSCTGIRVGHRGDPAQRAQRAQR
jgi:type IV secretion system protein VirB10